MEYFPTPSYRRAVLRMRSLLSKERERLEGIAERMSRKSAIGEDNLAEELPHILEFTAEYQDAYMRYLSAVLPQHRNGVCCHAGCANCCHHFPMSVEPFELIGFYSEIRQGTDLFPIIEECLFRSRTYHALLSAAERNLAEDPEDDSLVRYFGKGLACPFIAADGNCSAYASRPVTCRMYFSETPGEFCVPEHLQSDRNRSFIVYLPDDVEEQIADISLHFEPLSLPESLYEGVLALNTLENLFELFGSEAPLGRR